MDSCCPIPCVDGEWTLRRLVPVLALGKAQCNRENRQQIEGTIRRNNEWKKCEIIFANFFLIQEKKYKYIILCIECESRKDFYRRKKKKRDLDSKGNEKCSIAGASTKIEFNIILITREYNWYRLN